MLGERAEVIKQGLRWHLPDFAFSCGAGGSSVWVRGRDGLDARALADGAEAWVF